VVHLHLAREARSAQARAVQAACPSPVRAKRRTPRAPARAKHFSRVPGTKTSERRQNERKVLEDQITIV